MSEAALAATARWNIFASASSFWRGYAPASAVDTRRGDLVMFGMWTPGFCANVSCFPGADEAFTTIAHLGSGPEMGTPTILPGSPSRRSNAAAAYDSLTDRVWMFGGRQVVPTTCATPGCFDPPRHSLNDLWWLDRSVDPPQWHQALAGGSGPAPRFDAALMVDPIARRLLLFGGRDSSGTFFQDLWSLALEGPPSWSLVIPAGSLPSARASATALFDGARSRMLLVGGVDAAGTKADVWALSLGSTLGWSTIAVAGSPPALMEHAAIDRARDLVLTYSNPANIATFSLAGAPVWTPVTSVDAPVNTSPGGFGYDPIHDFFWLPFVQAIDAGRGTIGNVHALFTLASEPAIPALSPVRDSLRFSRGELAEYWRLMPARPTWSGVLVFDEHNAGYPVTATSDTAGVGVVFGRLAPNPGAPFSSTVTWIESGVRHRGPTVTAVAPPAPLTMDLTLETATFDTTGHVHVVWRCADDSLSWIAKAAVQKRFIDFWELAPSPWPDDSRRIIVDEDVVTEATSVDYQILWTDPTGAQDTTGFVHIPRSSPPIPPQPDLALRLGRPAPNPAGASFAIDLDTERGGAVHVRLLDLRGREVRRWDYTAPLQFRETFDLHGVAPGLYVVSFEQGQRRATRRLMVLR